MQVQEEPAILIQVDACGLQVKVGAQSPLSA